MHQRPLRRAAPQHPEWLLEGGFGPSTLKARDASGQYVTIDLTVAVMVQRVTEE